MASIYGSLMVKLKAIGVEYLACESNECVERNNIRASCIRVNEISRYVYMLVYNTICVKENICD